MVPEELAMHTRPDQATIRVDIDLGYTKLGGGFELFGVHTPGTAQFTAGSIDAGHFVLRNGAGAMHNQGEVGESLLDFCKHFKMQALGSAEFEGSMAGANGDSQ